MVFIYIKIKKGSLIMFKVLIIRVSCKILQLRKCCKFVVFFCYLQYVYSMDLVHNGMVTFADLSEEINIVATNC